MFKNFIVIALRNFKRNKFYSFLNIFGLAIGTATAIFSFLFVGYELSYDRFHEKSDRIYRIAVDALSGNTVIKQVFNPAIMPAALYNEYAEIEAVCRISGAGSATRVEFEDKVFMESNILLVDTTFFNIFTAEFVRGNPGPELFAPNKAVLTEKTAKKYFGDSDPVGKVLIMDDEYHIEVSAVIKEFPQNAHFHFDMLVSLLSFEGFYNSPHWFANNFRIYLLLHENQDYKSLEAKFPAFVNKYHYGGRYAEATNAGNKWELYLQPLTDIHLHSHLSGEFEANGYAVYVYIFGVVAIFILLIACINFVNMATAKSATRAREIGIRKVVGSGRGELIRQFLSESLIISGVSLILALIFVELALVYLPDLLGSRIEIPAYVKINLIPALIGLVLIVALLSGTYPALVLSAFKPAAVLKNQLIKGGRGQWSRNTLVIFQFAISIVLIIGTLVISRQLDFIQNERLGFDKEQVIVIKNANIIQNQLDAFKNELLAIPAVQSASVSHKLPGIRFNNIGFGAEGFDGGFTLNLCLGDPDFQDVLKFKMVKGRFFSREFATDTSAVVLNEAAVKLLGWDDPIGKKVNNWGDSPLHFTVIGVVEDLHYESMHTEIRPMGFFHMNGIFHWTPRYISVRVNTDNISETLDKMDHVWAGFSPKLPFEYSFFDQDYDNLYTNEMQTKKLFITFSMLAIFIACLGLFGLAAFMVEHRVREIGIRKVLGASVSGLVVLLSGQFTKWVLIANLIAWPVAWYAMNRWLENFVYRIEIEWWMYLLAGIIALIIALITVSAQAIKAAFANPVEALRYE
jgi:putative ABC transport system permease protein